MKKVFINKFEQFVIRHTRSLQIALIVAFFCEETVSGLMYGIISESKSSAISAISALIFFILFMYAGVLPALKSDIIVKRRNNTLNILEASENTIRLLECVPKKELKLTAILCNNRIAHLIDLGETEKAEEEIRLFWQTFNLRKLPAFVLICLHENMAQIKIQQNDSKGYDEQLRIIYAYYGKCNAIDKATLSVSDPLPPLLLGAEATFGEYTEDFESRALANLNTKNGKKRKKPPCPYDILSTYEILFIYFKRFEIYDKAKYYAEMIMKIGNEQFFAYREAREYLEKH